MSEDTTQTEVAQTETTVAEPSTAENTEPKEATPETQATSPESEKSLEEQMVPYKRFQEVNEKAKRTEELEARLKELEAKANPPVPEDEQTKAVKETLKSLGFVTQEQQQQELQRQREDAQLDKSFAKLEAKYDGKDGRPKFDRQDILDYYRETKVSNDPEVLYEQKYKKDLINWEVKQALNKTKGIKTEASDGSGSTQVASDDLKTAAMSGDKTALRAFLKRLS